MNGAAINCRFAYAAFAACALSLLALMMLQSKPVVVNVMPGQSVDLAPGIALEIHSFDVQHRENGTVDQYHVAGELDRHPFKASVNRPAEINGTWIAISDFGSILVSRGGIRLRLVAALGIALFALVWIKAGVGWMCVTASLFAANWLGSSGDVHAFNALQSVWGFMLASAIVLPFLALRDRSFSWVDLALELLLIVPLFILRRGHGELPPALQSPFFIPHVGCYVFGYLLIVRAALGRGIDLVPAGFAFMTTGLALGATWAQYCWGSWWSWDPKECWSLAAWATTGTFLMAGKRLRPWLLRASAVLIIATLTLVNFSSAFQGRHSYATTEESTSNNRGNP